MVAGQNRRDFVHPRFSAGDRPPLGVERGWGLGSSAHAASQGTLHPPQPLAPDEPGRPFNTRLISVRKSKWTPDLSLLMSAVLPVPTSQISTTHAYISPNHPIGYPMKGASIPAI